MKIKKNIFNHKLFVPLFAILACILWGTAFPFLKISYQELNLSQDDFFSNILFASYRFLLAALLLFIYLYFKENKKIFKLKKEDYQVLIILGLVQTALHYFFFYNGLANTTGVKASILNTLSIFLLVFLSHFLYRNDKLSLKKITGLLLGFCGVIIVNINQGSFNFIFTFLGEGFIIFSAICASIAGIMAKKISTSIDALIITAYQLFFGSIILFLISLIKVHPFSLDFNFKVFIILIYLAFVSAYSFTIWYKLITYNPLGYISLYQFIIPVSGVFFSALLLKEEAITTPIFLALILVASGIVIINYKKE